MPTISRRGFLALGAAGAAGTLAACGNEENPRAEGRDGELLGAALAAESALTDAYQAALSEVRAADQGVVNASRDASAARADELERLLEDAGGSEPTPQGSPPTASRGRLAQRTSRSSPTAKPPASCPRPSCAAPRPPRLPRLPASRRALRVVSGEEPAPRAFVTGAEQEPFTAPDETAHRGGGQRDHRVFGHHRDDDRGRMSAAIESRRRPCAERRSAPGAATAAGSPRPAIALGQSADDEDLRDFLVEAIALEQLTVLAYSTASSASGVDSELQPAPRGASAIKSRRTPTRCAARSTRSATTPRRRPTRPPTPRCSTTSRGSATRPPNGSRTCSPISTASRPATSCSSSLGELEAEQLDLYLGRAPGSRQRGPLDHRQPRSPAVRPSIWSSCGPSSATIRRATPPTAATARTAAGAAPVSERARSRARLRVRLEADPLDGRSGRQPRRFRPRRGRDEDLRRGRRDRAIRHCGCRVVTAGVDRMAFTEPVNAGELLNCSATVNAAWRTSMEVGVRVEAENPSTGERRHTSTAYVTMVALDDDGKPTPVPG